MRPLPKKIKVETNGLSVIDSELTGVIVATANTPEFATELLERWNKQKTELRKFHVCEDCYCVGITDTDCKCSYDKYKTIELEFEVCSCCGNLISEGSPADTEFNKKQLKQHND